MRHPGAIAAALLALFDRGDPLSVVLAAGLRLCSSGNSSTWWTRQILRSVRTIAAFDLLARFANGAQLRSCSWHAFTSSAVAELITAGLATAKNGRMRAGQRPAYCRRDARADY